MTRTVTFASVAILATLGLTAGSLGILAAGRGEARQLPMSQSYRSIGYQVTFLITQTQASASPSSDQMTIIFANRSIEGARPPKPFFGEDIVQEFSFSGADFVNNQLRFTRRVNDKSFLDARYIRVINYGVDGWGGDQISLTVDGQEILRNVRMTIRGDASKGLQNCNPRNWGGRSYWEAELARYRGSTKGSDFD
jgi:hypothetical protein